MIPIGETKDGRADMTNFEMDLFDTRVYHRDEKNEEEECCRNSIIKPACLPITILALLILMTFFVPMLNEDFRDAAVSSTKKYERTGMCTDQCSIQLVESIPTGMVYPSTAPRHTSTYNAWTELLRLAEKSVDITAVYWNMRDKSGYKTAWQGEEVFNRLIGIAHKGVKIRVAQNSAGSFGPLSDLDYLREQGLAQVQILNFTQLFGGGILHSKLWIIDNQHFYLGSANMDWQSLTEVKELGILMQNCSCLAWELNKIFTIYWRVGQDQKIPPVWPVYLRTKFNAQHPLQISFDGAPARTYISHSPEAMNPRGREHDLTAITGMMAEAEQYIRVAVMDYIPTTLYQQPASNNTFWPPIDNAIRAAAYRGVQVELLVSQWPHSKKEATAYLLSLLQINSALPKSRSGGLKGGNISIKFFRVPVSPEQKRLPFARVNHNKYMVTEKAAWIGTSNWSGDYFINTAGIGMIIERDVPNEEDGKSARSASTPSVLDQINAVFVRDWQSDYAFPLALDK